MATIYRKVYPVPLPDGAEIIQRRGQRVARWTDGNGNAKSAPLSADGTKVMHEAGCWYARYRDADGVDRRVSTNCNDEQAARQVASRYRINRAMALMDFNAFSTTFTDNLRPILLISSLPLLFNTSSSLRRHYAGE